MPADLLKESAPTLPPIYKNHTLKNACVCGCMDQRKICPEILVLVLCRQPACLMNYDMYVTMLT